MSYVDSNIEIERVTPFVSFIHLPERYVLEVRASGAYFQPAVARVSQSLLRPPSDFYHFSDIYSSGISTMDDIGYSYMRFYTEDNRTISGIFTTFYVLEQGMIFHSVTFISPQILNFTLATLIEPCRVK